MTRRLSPPISPEPAFKLLLGCLQPRPDPAAIKIDAQHDVDWRSFLTLCEHHEVRPLAYRALAAADWENVPGDVRTSLGQFNVRNSLRNTILTTELADLLIVFAQRGVRAATFKGPVLAENVYGSICLREFVDIDIIVPEDHFNRAESILIESGYQPLSLVRDAREYLAESGQSAFRRTTDGLGVDLHWKLASFGQTFPFREKDLWQELQTLPLSGRHASTLSSDHLALFLAFHGTKERWRYLKWICDFSALSRAKPELDWDGLLMRAERIHCSRSLRLAARLCYCLGLAAPEALLADETKDNEVEALVTRTMQALSDPQHEDTDLSVFTYQTAVAERLSDKARLFFILGTTLTVSDFGVVRLPARLRALYYLIRPFRLATKALALLVQSWLPRAAR